MKGKAAANGHMDGTAWWEAPVRDVRHIYEGISINLSNTEAACYCLPDLDHLSQEPPGCLGYGMLRGYRDNPGFPSNQHEAFLD